MSSPQFYQSLGLHTLRLYGILPGGRCACGRPSCPPRSAGKHPIRPSWQNTPPDLTFLPGENVGIKTGLQPSGLGLVALDVDEPEAFAALQTQLGQLPETLRTESGRGFHLLFAVPPALLGMLRNFVKRCGIDLRAEGGQVVAAPSLHYSGKQYACNGAPVAWLPQGWFAWLAAGSEPRPLAAGAEARPRPADDRWLPLARAMVAEAPAVYRGSPGLTWKLAVRLVRGLELSLTSAYALLEAYNALSDEPLPPEKLQRAVEQAAAASELPWGFARPLRPGSLNHAESPAELSAPPPAAAPQLSLGALSPEQKPEPAEFAPKVRRTEQLTAAALSEIGARRGCKPAVKRLCDGIAFDDVKEFSDALRQLAYCQPDGVEWAAHSVQQHLQRCWTGDAMSFNLAEAWSNILQSLRECDLGITGLQEILYRHPAWQGCLAFDEMAQQAVWRKPPPITRKVGEQVTDADCIAFRTWLDRNAGGDPGKDKAWDAICNFSENHASFNPLQDWLGALRWDGQPRLDGWLVRAMGAEPTDFNVQAGSKWLISAVARAMQPGCKVDYALVLQGSQEGEGKSTVFEKLAMRDEWFTVLGSDLGSKESKEMLRGKWILCLDELASLRRSEYAAVKSFITMRTDDFREAYGRKTKQHRRRGVFCATVNDSEFLNEDPERRWWPVSVRQLDLPWLLANRDQLWAEAFGRWQAGANFWDIPRELRLEAQASFRKADPLGEVLQQWLNRATDPKPFKIIDAMSGCGLKLDDTSGMNRLAAALRRAGYRVKVSRSERGLERLWTKGD
jgi:hypothetical protein